MTRLFATVGALALFALPAIAQETMDATASAVNGTVQVNTGEQFQPLQSGQALRPGDRVMATGSGSATISFSDGCTLTVEPGTMVTVPAVSTCAGGVVAAQSIAPASGKAVGSSAAYSGGVDWTGVWIIAGTVLVGGAVMFNEDEKNTVSP